MQDIEATFREAFEKHSNELFRHAAMRLPDRDRALDLTQECFLRALGYAKKGEEIREIRPFLFRTLRHLIIDEYRKAKNFSLEEMTEGEDGEQYEKLLRDDHDPLEEALNRFEGSRALEMVVQLPDMYREVIAMRYVHDLSIREIAETVGVSENVISVRLHRGLKKLHSLLSSEGGSAAGGESQ